MTASTVWINGIRLGEYKGGFTPFSFGNYIHDFMRYFDKRLHGYAMNLIPCQSHRFSDDFSTGDKSNLIFSRRQHRYLPRAQTGRRLLQVAVRPVLQR